MQSIQSARLSLESSAWDLTCHLPPLEYLPTPSQNEGEANKESGDPEDISERQGLSAQ